jgi:hypothetical protein
VEGEVGRWDIQGGSFGFWEPSAPHRVVSLWMRSTCCMSLMCGSVSQALSHPEGLEAPLGRGWQSLETTKLHKQSLPCSHCQAEWIQCALIMNEGLIATALKNYDVMSLTVPWSRVQMMLECIIGMLASVKNRIINQAP